MDQTISNVSSAAEVSPIIVVVMGVSGCGKSTLASRLASTLGLPFIDADTLHPQSNIDKMSKGIPLTDEDRAPWLLIVRNQAEKICADQTEESVAPSSLLPPDHVSTSNESEEKESEGVGEANANGVHPEIHKTATPSETKLRGAVVACSALRQQYRETLRGSKHHHEDDGSAHGDSNSHPIPTYFVFLKGERETLFARMSSRKNHFMKAAMLDSQLKTLESPDETGEEGIITVRVEEAMDRQVELAKEGLRRFGISC